MTENKLIKVRMKNFLRNFVSMTIIGGVPLRMPSKEIIT